MLWPSGLEIARCEEESVNRADFKIEREKKFFQVCTQADKGKK